MNVIDKSAARHAAFARRKLAFEAGHGSAALLSSVLAGHRGVPIAGYAAMRTELDPLPALEEAAAHGPVGYPVIIAASKPLKFREWTPGCELEKGAFGAMIPAKGDWIVPQIVVVPLVAFSKEGGRLGYGGGFYDRTLEELRVNGSVLAIGFAFDAQEDPEIPLEPTDQPLDMIVTESKIIDINRFSF